MARCNCSGAKCSCVIVQGDNTTVTGSGRPEDPYVVSASSSGGPGGGGDWQPGDIKYTARATAPAGWLVADGSSVSRTAYPNLFAAIGTLWGAGDGVSTFTLPNYTGKVIVGVDNSHRRGTVGGSPEFTLDIANVPVHSHSMDHNHPQADTGQDGAHHHPDAASASAGGHVHDLQFSTDPGTSQSHVPKGQAAGAGSGNGPVVSAGAHTHNLTIGTDGGHSHTYNVPSFDGDTGNAGRVAPDAIPTMPPYGTALPLIKT